MKIPSTKQLKKLEDEDLQWPSTPDPELLQPQNSNNNTADEQFNSFQAMQLMITI